MWFKNCRYFHSLPAIVSWKIWNVRNTNIFEYHLQDQRSICIHILNMEKEFRLKKAFSIKPRGLKDIQNRHAFGLFDGATNDGICVDGVVLRIINSHSFNFQLQCEKG